MKFLVTGELGKLAKWMRLLGYDTEYTSSVAKGSILIKAGAEERVILTRDKKLAEKAQEKAVFVVSGDLNEQLRQVISDARLKIDSAKIFSICLLCNREVVGIPKETVRDKVPEYVYNTQRDFVECQTCHKIYWQGSHYENAPKKLAEIYRNNLQCL